VLRLMSLEILKRRFFMVLWQATWKCSWRGNASAIAQYPGSWKRNCGLSLSAASWRTASCAYTAMIVTRTGSFPFRVIRSGKLSAVPTARRMENCMNKGHRDVDQVG
jgi:hypothetical protein